MLDDCLVLPTVQICFLPWYDMPTREADSAVQAKTGHEKSFSDIMTMMCEFSGNILMGGGLVMPQCQPRYPITGSLSFLIRRRRSANAQTRRIIEVHMLCAAGPRGTLSCLERGVATASIVHKLVRYERNSRRNLSWKKAA